MSVPEFPKDLHGSDKNPHEKLVAFIEFADELVAEIVKAVVSTLGKDGDDKLLAHDLERSHAHERSQFLVAQVTVRNATSDDMLKHRLLGPLLDFKTWVIKRISDGLGTARQGAKKILSFADQILPPVTTLITSIFEMCKLPSPAEFLSSLGDLVGILNRKPH